MSSSCSLCCGSGRMKVICLGCVKHNWLCGYWFWMHFCVPWTPLGSSNLFDIYMSCAKSPPAINPQPRSPPLDKTMPFQESIPLTLHATGHISELKGNTNRQTQFGANHTARHYIKNPHKAHSRYPATTARNTEPTRKKKHKKTLNRNLE